MAHGGRHPQPGDLIEIDGPLHQHWALYMGNGYVVHLTPVGKRKLKLGGHKVPLFTRKVMKELLKNVVGKKKWRINNKSDQYHTPLPVKKIIGHAEGYIGKEVPYRSFGSNCEQFVKKLRYGDQLSALLGGEEHLHPMIDGKDYPNPGDLIEIKRGGYEHWALYVGNGYVIHITPVEENSPPVSAGSVTLLTKRAMVKKEVLKKVVGNDDWNVNNKYDRHRIPFPMEEIIRRAERWIGKVVPYRLFRKNCEHFVTQLRYGEGVSEQARRALEWIRYITTAVAGAGIVGVSAALPVSLPVVAAGASFGTFFNWSALFHNLSRLNICGAFKRAQRDILERRCC